MDKIDLGAVSAYALAVKHGYQGTEEEWAALQAESANNAARAEEAAERAESVKNSIPEDYNTLQEKVHKNSADISLSAPAIVITTTGEVITVTDSAERPLAGLTLYGKTTQDGTPAPDAPIPLVSVGSGGTIQVNACGRNLFDAANPLKTGANIGNNSATAYQSISGRSVYIPISPLTTYSVKKATSTIMRIATSPDIPAGGGTITACKGLNAAGTEALTITSGENDHYLCVNLFVNTDSNDMLSLDVHLPTLMIEVGDTASPYEFHKDGGSVTVSTPNGLPGIPVNSGGNYTDANGQQWMCDEVDFGRGVYVQRVNHVMLADVNVERYEYPSGSGLFRFTIRHNTILPTTTESIGLCNRFVYSRTPLASNSIDNTISSYNGGNLYVRCDKFTTAEDFKAWLAENQLEVIYNLATPVETALSADELSAYRAMTSQYPETTVTNDAGAWMQLDYIAGTQNYIDQRIEERSIFRVSECGIPVLTLTGNASGMSADNAVPLRYEYMGRSGSATVKWQGHTAIGFPKKNLTVKFDAAFEMKAGWGKMSKAVLKADWVDASGLRNWFGAKLWGRMVKTRESADEKLKALPNGGAIDGFKAWVILNGNPLGLYTWTIPKGAEMLGMTGASQTEAIVCAENAPMNAPVKCDETDFTIEYSANGDSAAVTASLNAMITAISSVKSADDLPALEALVDIDSVVDYYVHMAAICNIDGMSRNFTMFTRDGVKWHMNPYDMDAILGNNPYGTAIGFANDWPMYTGVTGVNALLDVVKTYYADRIKARHESLRWWEFGEIQLQHMLYEMALEVPEGLRIEELMLWPSRPGTGANNLNQMLEWLRLRMAALDNNILTTQEQM